MKKIITNFRRQHPTLSLVLIASILGIIISIILSEMALSAPIKKHESYYRDKYCEMVGGETEVVVKNNKRVDCETEEFAVELDFGKNGYEHKYYECIGQALSYSAKTGKDPKCVLISNDPEKYESELREVQELLKKPVEFHYDFMKLEE